MVDDFTERVVTSRGTSGDVRLAVREYGDRGAPHVVLVHGYPDNQTLWEGVLARVDGVHAVTYDVRGAGRSDAPRRIRDYRNARLVDDLVAVVEATVPDGERFVLVGHDWGSIQLWDALDDPRLAGRIQTFVSASGPSIDHVATTLRGVPTAAKLRQLGNSFYIFAFQVPWLPERAWRGRHRLTPAMLRLTASQGGASEWSPQLARDAAHGVMLYRANALPKLLRPRPPRTDLPVVLVVAARDRFVGPTYLVAVDDFCSDVRRVEVDAPHWHPLQSPELLAGVIGYEVHAGNRT